MPEILIIEDERPIAELLKYSLEREGYQVRMAHTGADGLPDVLQAADIALAVVLTDVGGPLLPQKAQLPAESRRLRRLRSHPGGLDAQLLLPQAEAASSSRYQRSWPTSRSQSAGSRGSIPSRAARSRAVSM